MSFIAEGVRDPIIGGDHRGETLKGAARRSRSSAAIGAVAVALALRHRLRARMTRRSLAITGALMRRALNEVIRVPGAAIPGVIAPTLFLLGLTAVFGKLTERARASAPTTTSSFLAPVTLLQCAGFTGAATGVNLARDIEQGWFDRLLVAPVAARRAARRRRPVGRAARAAAGGAAADRRRSRSALELPRRRRDAADRSSLVPGFAVVAALLGRGDRAALPHPGRRAR